MPHGNLVWLKWMGAYIYANLSLHDIVAEELDILETPKISKEPKQAIDGGNVHREKHGQSEKKIGLRVNLRPIRLRGLAIQSKDLLVQQSSVHIGDNTIGTEMQTRNDDRPRVRHICV